MTDIASTSQVARVLILEDNDDFRSLLQSKLESEGFEVAAVPDGTRALELMARQPPDVVLTDLFMPDKDGIETILEIRARYPRARIIAMSGWQSRAKSDYLTVAREIGAVQTFRKPFELQEMVQALRQLANGSD
jgi:CheY-like chemotaxis protein